MEGLKNILLFITYEDKIIKYALPGVNDRKVKINLFEQTGIKELELTLEVWDESWFICSTPQLRISRNHLVVDEEEIKEGYIYNGKIYETNFRFQIRVTRLGTEETYYTKYIIESNQKQIRLGSDISCQLVLHNSYVSRCHTVLFFQGGFWYIEDRSKNGTYLNGQRISQIQKLTHGDRIIIMDYQIYFLGNVLAVNKERSVESHLPLAEKKKLFQSHQYPKRQWFSRSPRFIQPIDTEMIEIEGPPTVQLSKKVPLYLTIGPSLTMPIPILLMVLFNIVLAQSSGSGINSFSYFGMAISVIMFSALGIMWTMLRRNYDESCEIEIFEERDKAYKKYITQNENYIEEKKKKNKRILENIYLSSDFLLLELLKNSDILWNRNINHEDFLTIRIGTGPIKLPNEIRIPKQKFSVENDPLISLPAKVEKDNNFVEQMPKIFSLKKYKIVGVVGDESFLYNMVNSMIIQVVALHSYIDVKTVFLMEAEQWEDRLNWVKWLPHTFDSEKRIRFIANSEDTWENVQQELVKEIKFREEMEKENTISHDRNVYQQHFLIFVSNREVFNHSILYQYMISDKNFGFTFILLYGQLSRLPNECRFILENTKTFHGAYQLNEAIGRNNMLHYEEVEKNRAEKFAKMLNQYVLQEMRQTTLPESIDFLSMIGVGKIEQWDLIKHYKENRSYEGIRAWLGMMPGNRPMFLDIHEKKYGPHGLIAGTTGSGKSELIQTFILSLALNYHPSEVAFILIDYKGGGMAKIFEGLPHVAGMILDLEEENENANRNQTRRTFLSIRSELKRREKIFNQYHVNHIDDYMRLYRKKKAKEPLPHLIIISDEFAELKKEQPEFIKELVSTARVGRSIGVHLILATQKPAGVVDDQIFSNSRFKICLRVQDKTDSNEMLRRPEAAFLSTTGRAYFQLGNNELFEIFQSGYSGADYEPKDRVSSADEEEAMMIRIDGLPAAVSHEKKREKDVPSQIRVSIDYIKKITKQNKIMPVKQLWMPPLPEVLYLNEIKKHDDNRNKMTILAFIGLIDDPERQNQRPLYLEFDNFSNLMIIGNQGCGKSTLIQTILYDLASEYTTNEVNFYIFDFSSGLLRNFGYSSHCGKVSSLEEEDAIVRTLKYLLNTMDERDKLFQHSGVGSYWEYKKMSSNPLPLIFFVIDNYFAFTESFEKYETDILKILRGGQRVGIQAIVSVNRMNDMKFRLRQNFTKILPLQLNDKMDYSEAVGGSLDGFTTQIKGRGLCKEDGIFEFQAALSIAKETEFERIQTMTEEFKKNSNTNEKAKQIFVIPQGENYEEFISKLPEIKLEKGIPLGYEQEEIVPFYVNFSDFFCYLISGTTEKAVINVMKNFCNYFQKFEQSIYMVSFGANHFGSKIKEIYRNGDDIFHMLLLLKNEFTRRNKWRKDYLKQNSSEKLYEALLQEFEPMYFIIEDFGAFLEIIYANHGEESYYPITELFFREGKGLAIWFIAGIVSEKSVSAPYTLAYKYFVEDKKGIHLGGKLNSQKLFDCNLPIAKQTMRLEENIGCVMEKDKLRYIFVPWNDAK